MPNAGEVRERKIPGTRTSLEPTAVDVAGSMFVASAELVLSTLEELNAHVGAVRTKKEVEDGRRRDENARAHYFAGQKKGAAATGASTPAAASPEPGHWPRLKRWLKSTFV